MAKLSNYFYICLTSNKNYVMNIGNRLKSLRIEKNFEPLDMAIKIGVSETTYRRYERDEASPDLHILEKMASALDKNILDFLPDNIVFENKNQSGGVALAYHSTINMLSDKVIELFERQLAEKDERLKDKDILIAELKAIIEILKKNVMD